MMSKLSLQDAAFSKASLSTRRSPDLPEKWPLSLVSVVPVLRHLWISQTCSPAGSPLQPHLAHDACCHSNCARCRNLCPAGYRSAGEPRKDDHTCRVQVHLCTAESSACTIRTQQLSEHHQAKDVICLSVPGSTYRILHTSIQHCESENNFPARLLGVYITKALLAVRLDEACRTGNATMPLCDEVSPANSLQTMLPYLLYTPSSDRMLAPDYGLGVFRPMPRWHQMCMLHPTWPPSHAAASSIICKTQNPETQ